MIATNQCEQYETPDVIPFPQLLAAPAELTLRQVFETHLEPTLGDCAPKTIIDYQTTLNDWERLTENPPVSQLSKQLFFDFRAKLQQEVKSDGKHRSPATINKKFRTLGPLVRLCWPADSENPDGLGLCGYFRLPRRLKEKQKLPRIFSHNEMTKLYNACDQLSWPNASHSPDLWRAAIVLAFNVGARTYDLFSLRWKDVEFDYRNVGAVKYQACKTGKLQRVPLNPIARLHLLQLKSLNIDAERLFPGFDYSNASSVNRNWRKLLSAAGITERHCFEDFRKTCNTTFDDYFEGVGAFVLGHSLSGVNAKNYSNPTRRVFRAVQRIPQPKAFKAILETT